ncbi:hypothetical protein Q604_UNBc4C00166G0001, partial [human gut metagenome]
MHWNGGMNMVEPEEYSYEEFP